MQRSQYRNAARSTFVKCDAAENKETGTCEHKHEGGTCEHKDDRGHVQELAGINRRLTSVTTRVVGGVIGATN